MLGLRVVERASTSAGALRRGQPWPGVDAAPRVWEVAALVHAVADTLASRFAVCAVQGEISGFSRAPSGHCYFSLKDANGGDALLRCAMFRRAASLLDFAPGNGVQVEVRGRLAVYEPRGELQFVVESMQRAGAGALFEQFLRLKARLEAEGLFDPARKRPLPAWPRSVGVITSLSAAALHDVLTSLRRRSPHVAVVVYPSLVQGAEAPAALVAALQLAAQRREVDTLLLCRGGGSLEDLWAFNDERVVRAVAASPIPVVCGVGHETDTSLCDFAADLRAPTPTAAAELATPATRDATEALAAVAALLQRRVEVALDRHAQRLDAAALRLSRPGDRVQRQQRLLDHLAQRRQRHWQTLIDQQSLRLERLAGRLGRQWETQQQRQHQRLEALATRLQALDPQQVLARGYAWLSDGEGRPVASVKALQLGQDLTAVLGDGQAGVTVSRLPEPSPRPAPRTGRRRKPATAPAAADSDVLPPPTPAV